MSKNKASPLYLDTPSTSTHHFCDASFHFDKLDADQMREQLLDSLPGELYSLASKEPITVDTMRHMLANRTAARFSDLDEAVLTLASESEIEIMSAEGRIRSRNLTRLSATDLISLPRMRLLPGFSRLSDL